MLDTANIDAYLIPGTDPDVVALYQSLPQLAQQPLALVEDDVIVLDTETTGLDPAHDALIEIAAVRLSGADIVDRFQTFVNPGCPIPAEITELTGITDADVANAPDPSLAVEQFAEFAAGHDLVAHNASFDRGFIMRQAVPGAITGTWLDTLELSHIAFPRFKTHRLADLARAFGAPASTHRAGDDVEALAPLWRIMLAAVSAMPAGLAERIATLAPGTDWPLRTVFQRAAAAQPGVDFSLRRLRDERARSSAPQAAKYDAEEVPLVFPSEDDIRQAFAEDGAAGHMYADYEQRKEQVGMALEVGGSFRSNGFSVLEAGTGVGKSMAYLLPTVQLAQESAITCGIATKTNALMDQLVYHELPRLSKALGGVSYLALKGYDHYPCLRKLERFTAEADELRSADIEMLATLYAYLAQTSWGDLDAVNLYWYGMSRSSIEASPQSCLKAKCPFFPRRCLLHGARRMANTADIVVTNHALLFRDVQMDNGILPPIRHWVVDEAHAVETEARKQLSLSISARELEHLLARLTNARTGSLAQVRRRAPESDGGSMLYGVTADIDSRAGQVRAVGASFFSFVKDLENASKDGAGGGYDRMTLWVGPELRQTGAWLTLEAPGYSLAKKLDGLVKRLRDLIGMLEEFEGEFSSAQADLVNTASTLAGMMQALTLILDGEDDSYVYSAEIDRNPDRVNEALTAEKLDIGAELAASFYPNTMSVVYTSATLATGDAKAPFAHFLHTSGLDLMPAERVCCTQLDSSYDFERNMRILLPTDLPEPNQSGYREALSQLLLEVHRAMGGSTLTLFTNRREMEALYRQLKPQLAAEGIDLVAQTRGTNVKSLRDRFLEERELSLFALRSFWEGFDAPGSTLRCVVIPKLPFGRPTDPIARERELREHSKAWRRYSLPEAVMDLKQAAGRLIRKSTDSGYLVLADARLQTKGYGKIFLRAMPTSNVQRLSTQELAERIRSEQ